MTSLELSRAIYYAASSCDEYTLLRHTNLDLATTCRQLGMSGSGNKDTLVERLLIWSKCPVTPRQRLLYQQELLLLQTQLQQAKEEQAALREAAMNESDESDESDDESDDDE